MSIKSVLFDLKILAKDNNLSEPYIVGGLPRDKLLNRSDKIEDVDITTGDESVKQLAQLAANKFKVEPKQFQDGHYQLNIDHIKYDFSSNFNSPDAEYFLKKAGIDNPTPMQLELFSRDFTCNTLIVPMSLRVITDPTGLAIDDIKHKIIKTPLPPRITLRDDPKRVVRSIYLSVKLGFDIEDDIIFWVKNNHEFIKSKVSNGYARNKLSSASKVDINKTIKLMDNMELWDVLEIPKDLFSTKYRAVP